MHIHNQFLAIHLRLRLVGLRVVGRHQCSEGGREEVFEVRRQCGVDPVRPLSIYRQ